MATEKGFSGNGIQRIISLASVPPFKVRYRNAIASIGFIITMTTLIEYLTSKQLKSSTPYRYSLSVVKDSSEVKSYLGVPINEGWTVRSKRNQSEFLLKYSVYGSKNKATVEALTQSQLKNTKLLYLAVQIQKGPKIILFSEKKPQTHKPGTDHSDSKSA
eukprot:TRINITY_DN10677_c0_g1_i1.p1 TRINITY_DN10677_c0_g1~~TRINITY_DN10677_c0_g1_i1.p1  ORF type:complete len:160 (+),score=26.38 TRINITY_DN10677_c0_g1_i1:18-497(+)